MCYNTIPPAIFIDCVSRLHQEKYCRWGGCLFSFPYIGRASSIHIMEYHSLCEQITKSPISRDPPGFLLMHLPHSIGESNIDLLLQYPPLPLPSANSPSSSESKPDCAVWAVAEIYSFV